MPRRFDAPLRGAARFRRIVLAIAALPLPALSVQQNATWDGGAGFWSQLHWNSATVANPTNGGGTTWNIFVDSFHLADSALFLDSSRTIDSLSVSDRDTLNIQNNTGLTIVAGGTLFNTGAINLTSGGNTTSLAFDNDTSLGGTGGGVITLGNSANYIVGVTGDERITNVNNTIQGAGHLLNNAAALTNQFLVDANTPAAVMDLDPNASGVINTGTLRASNGGVLSLNSGSVDNTNGVIAAVFNNGANNSRVDLSSVSITNGTLSTQGNGVIRSTGGTVSLNSVTNSGNLVISNNTSITLVSSLTNTGTITFAAAGNATSLFLSGNVTLSGTGTVNLNGSTSYIQGASTGNERLTNQSTIQGAGQFLNNVAKLTNQSLVDANLPGLVLTVNPSAGADGVVNANTMRASSGGILALTGGTWNNAGGVIAALAGSRVDLNSLSLTGGTLTSSGSGFIRSTGGTVLLTDVTSSADYHVPNNTSTHLAGTFNNLASVTLDATGNTTALYLSGDVSLTGGGTLVMNGATAYVMGAVSGTERLTNLDNTIQGRGQLLNNVAKLTNKSSVLANVDGAVLTIDPATGADGVINHGTLAAVSGGILSLAGGTFDQFDPATTSSPGVISAAAGSHVSLNTVSINTGTLLSTDSGFIQSTGGAVNLVNLTNDSDYRIPNNTSTTLTGTLTNLRSILVDSGGNNTFLNLSGDVTLTGGGTVALAGPTPFLQGAASGTERLINLDNRILGGGNLLNNVAKLTNHSLIDANTPGASLTINPAAGADGVVNSGGTLRASDGGILTLFDGSFNNAGGTVAALDTSHVDLNSLSLTGGVLTSAGSGYVRATGGFVLLTDVTSSADYHVVNNANTGLAGTFTNLATFSVDSGGNNTFVFLSGDVVLNGGGTVNLIGTTAFIQGLSSGNERLTNVNNLIQGRGNLLNNSGKLTNQSLVDANVTGASLIINPSAGADGVVNTATLRASGGGILTLFDGAFTNTGGTIAALDASRVDLSSVSLSGGLLTSSGTGVIRSTGGSVVLANLTNAADYHIPNNTSTTLLGTLTNTAAVSIDSGGNNTFIYLSGDVVLTGGGTVNLTGTTAFIQGLSSGNERLTNVNNTIQGRGNLLNNSGKLTNQSLVDANVTGASLIINPSAGADGVVNVATLRATNGGVLTLAGGTWNNTGGTISALGNNGGTASRVDLNSLTLTGGTLTSASPGLIRATGGAVLLSGLTNAADYHIPNNVSTNLSGTITNTAAFSVDSGGNNTFLNISGDVTLAGGGTVNLLGPTAFVQGAATGNERLTNQDNTVQGGGQLGNNALAITNNGTILASSATQLTINPNGSGITNNGTLRANTGSTLVVTDGLTNLAANVLTGGTYYAAGTLRIASANITTNAANITLDGAGSAFTDTAGAPLNALRNLAVNEGSLTLTSGRTLTTGALTNPGTITLGPNSGLRVNGALSNPGTVDFAGGNSSLLLDYTGPSPAPAVQTMINTNHLTHSASPFSVIVYAEASSIGLTTFAGSPVDSTALFVNLTLPGDANFSGTIDPDDFALTDRGFNKHLTGWFNGDFNGDGSVTSADYLILDTSYLTQGGHFSPSLLTQRESQFGQTYVASLLASVPEPSLALSSILYPLSSLLLRRRR